MRMNNDFWYTSKLIQKSLPKSYSMVGRNKSNYKAKSAFMIKRNHTIMEHKTLVHNNHTICLSSLKM